MRKKSSVPKEPFGTLLFCAAGGGRIATGAERPRNDRLEEMRCKPGRRGEGTPPYPFIGSLTGRAEPRPYA